MGSDQEQAAIKKVIATFPETFGLRKFPGDVFRIGLDQSYFTGPYNTCTGTLYLYTERKVGDDWVDFAKGTEDELRRQITS